MSSKGTLFVIYEVKRKDVWVEFVLEFKFKKITLTLRAALSTVADLIIMSEAFKEAFTSFRIQYC